MKTPPYLKKNDTIGLVCTSGFMPLQKSETCINVLKQQGYKVVVGETVGNQFNYFSGTDEERINDLQVMLNNPNVQAILCARGGYGLSRIIDKIDFSFYKKNPKWIIGFSDITVLHNHINTNLKIATIHAPMVAAFNNEQYKNPYVQSLLKALKGTTSNYKANTHAYNNIGTATGELVGGNLCMIAHLIGSKSAIKTNNKILFLEDVGEYLYNIDRMFIQLKRAGVLNNLAGLIIGKFSDTKDTETPFGSDVYTIIKSHLTEYNYPICFNFPVSHDVENVALKVGLTHQLTITNKLVQLKEVTS